MPISASVPRQIRGTPADDPNDMNVYFSYSRVPELARLTPKQRKLVYRCAMEALFSDQPSTLWVCIAIFWGSLLVGALAGWLAAAPTGITGPAWWQTKWFIVALAGVAGAVIG